MRSRALALVVGVVVLASLLVGVARSAGADSPGVRTSAHFVTMVWKINHSCAGAFGIEFKEVRGATLYTVRYRQTLPGLKPETVTFPDVVPATRKTGYTGPLPPAGSGFFILAGTICSANNPYAARSSAPEAFAVSAEG